MTLYTPAAVLVVISVGLLPAWGAVKPSIFNWLFQFGYNHQSEFLRSVAGIFSNVASADGHLMTPPYLLAFIALVAVLFIIPFFLCLHLAHRVMKETGRSQ